MIKFPPQGVIWLSALLAVILQILPLPVMVEAFRPDWVLACLVYWCIALPYRANIGTAFFFGLALDVLFGSTVGVNALAMTIVAYIAAANYSRLRNFSVWQQALVVGGLVIIRRLTVFWAESTVQDVSMYSGFFYPVFTTTLIWPWVFLILRKIRRQLKMK